MNEYSELSNITYEETDILYNKHYIRTDEEHHITAGFSDAFQQPQAGDICITERGGYQFRLYPGGEENPALWDEYGVPLYRWDGEAAQRRSVQELEADRPEPQSIPLSDTDILILAVTELADKTGVRLESLSFVSLERLAAKAAAAQLTEAAYRG